MIEVQSLNFIYKIMDQKNISHSTFLKDIIPATQNAKTFNLQGIMEILNTSADVDVQVKLFSILSAYVLSNDAELDAIITCNPLYDKICRILANSPPRKIIVTLNFLSAILYVDDEDSQRKKSLVVYAKNMIRSSGCLAAMCELFTSCMMHQDAWSALCRCVAESSRGVEANQNYCTHLVSLCIQRCSQRNIEVLSVLQSLLHNNTRNINLFIECNGLSLFQREYQHNVCLQLLATIVQSSAQAVALIVNTDICQQLREFLHLYGPQSQLGQWATIILYHTSKLEVRCEDPDDINSKEVDDHTKTFVAELNPAHRSPRGHLESTANTSRFFQNVMKEIIQCRGQKEFKDLTDLFPTDIKTNQFQRISIDSAPRALFPNILKRNKDWMSPQETNKFSKNRVNPFQNESLQLNKDNDLSFSFLRKQYLNNRHDTTRHTATDKVAEKYRSIQNNDTNVERNTIYESFVENNNNRFNSLDLHSFKPTFSSTPKKVSRNDITRYTRQQLRDKTRKTIQKSVREHKMKRRMENMRASKYLERSKNDTEVKNRSISGRFFDAINTSCTIFVRTVKNIFRPKSDSNATKVDSSNIQDTLSCSYSFTNYMRRRDAILNGECMDKFNRNLPSFDSKSNEGVEDLSIEMNNSCNTCNDTISLKRKLANDDYLKRTVRKLKLGINLYGCDFKKISRTMWAQETYMTPAVLYNLYRKLIIK